MKNYRCSSAVQDVELINKGAATLITPAKKQKEGTVHCLLSNRRSLRFAWGVEIQTPV